MVNSSISHTIANNMEMVRGDTLAFNFQLQGLEGGTPTFAFRVTRDYEDAPVAEADSEDGISQVAVDSVHDITTFAVGLSPSKTASLDTGKYYYDLTMYLEDNVITLMRGTLTLFNEVERG